jgi:hypothetical protein
MMKKTKGRKLFEFCFYLGLLILVFVDPFLERHHPFLFEQFYASVAAYGFFSCVSLILIAKVLRRVVKRREDYFD